MPPKKKSASKAKGKKIQKPTPQPSDPLRTVGDEKPVATTANEEGSSKNEVNSPAVAAAEEKVNLVENSKTETVLVVKMEEHEAVALEETRAVDEEKNMEGEDPIRMPEEEIKEADGKASEIREDLAEELIRGGSVALEEATVVNGEKNMEGEDPMRKPKVQGNKQADKEETDEDEYESVSGDVEENDDEEEEEEEGDNDNSSAHTQSSLPGNKKQKEFESLPGNKKQKEFELHIGGLDKGASEEDLTKVFGVFGDIQSIRIARHPVTQRNKGFAFIQYASFDHTKKALAELKDGAEVNGKMVRVSASQNNTTLYIGNICKSWTKELVLETLKGYGVEQIGDILLPVEPNKDGNNKGHVFVEFKSHADAVAAFQCLRKSDVVFGRDTSAKVSFSHALIHPCEEDLLKVKTVYLEGLPNSWDVSKIQEVCKKYGEIVRTELPKLRRKKRVGFVEFSSRDSAAACIDGFNSSDFEGNVNLKASFAKPLSGSQFSKQPRGGSKPQNDENAKFTNKNSSTPKKNNGKGKSIHKTEERKSDNTKNKARSNSQYRNSKEKRYETQQSARGNKRGREGVAVAQKHHPFKKARNDHKVNSRSSYSSNLHTPRQAQYNSLKRSRAPSYRETSASRFRSNDLEPHAGLLPPASQARNQYAYDERRGDTYHLQPTSSSGAHYLQPTSSYGGHHLQPTTGVHHYQAPASSAYAGGVAVPLVQSSYPRYSTYPAGSYQGGYVYPSSGAYSYPRPYYG